jgi:hypothetical protein
VTQLEATERVREARARYFAENGFGNGILDRTVGALRREFGLDA